MGEKAALTHTALRQLAARFVRLIDAVSLVAAVLAAVLLVGIAAAVFYEVLARAVGAPTEWSLEITSYALVWCGFVGAAYTLKRERHVRVDLVIERLPVSVARFLEYAADVLALVFCLLMVYHSVGYVRLSWVNEVTSVSPLRVPMFIPQIAVPLGMVLLSLQLLARIASRAALGPVKDHS